jgi:hypothetical protein
MAMMGTAPTVNSFAAPDLLGGLESVPPGHLAIHDYRFIVRARQLFERRLSAGNGVGGVTKTMDGANGHKLVDGIIIHN